MVAAHSLQHTPTWAVATWLKEHKKTAVYEAIQKLKSALMLLGLMSLILVTTQRTIAKICIPNKVANSMLPCHSKETLQTTEAYELRHTTSPWFEPLAFEDDMVQPQHRRLDSVYATSNYTNGHCASKGMTSFISEDGINQLNTFICVLAIMQIVYSLVTMALGRAKMRSWKAWEQETVTLEYMVANDPNRFRFTRQTTFGRRHMSDSINTTILLWIAHLSTNNYFNFRKYIQRSLEDDFKVVVGISPLMWFLLVILMLTDIHGWHVYLWVSLLPLVIVLVLGTKLQVIVARMALRLKEQNKVTIGAPLVTPNDDLFWFSKPQFVLTLLHYTLFVNAFEFAFFVWVTLQYGVNSCFHETKAITISRVVLAVFVQVICSYITLPLYALVTQMGSTYKSAVLEEQTIHVIKQWLKEVKEKRRKQTQTPSDSPISNIVTQLHSMDQHSRTPSPPPSHGAKGTNEIIEEIQEAE